MYRAIQKLPEWLCRRIAVSVVYSIGLACIVQPLLLYAAYWTAASLSWSHLAEQAATTFVVDAILIFAALSMLDRISRRRSRAGVEAVTREHT
jgi:hypothetical protein